MPVSDANYVTLEGGLQYYVDEYNEDLGLIPVLAGYRYTLNQSGTGLYVEPNAGYTFGSSSIEKYDENGNAVQDGYNPAYEKVAGPSVGMNVGFYLNRAGEFNLTWRYVTNIVLDLVLPTHLVSVLHMHSLLEEGTVIIKQGALNR